MGVVWRGHCKDCGRTSSLEPGGVCWSCYRKSLVKDAPLPVQSDSDLLDWVRARDEIERLCHGDLRDYRGIRYDSLNLILRSIRIG